MSRYIVYLQNKKGLVKKSDLFMNWWIVESVFPSCKELDSVAAVHLSPVDNGHHPPVFEAGSGEGAPGTRERASERAIVQRLSSLKLVGSLRASELLSREKQRDNLP